MAERDLWYCAMVGGEQVGDLGCVENADGIKHVSALLDAIIPKLSSTLAGITVGDLALHKPGTVQPSRDSKIGVFTPVATLLNEWPEDDPEHPPIFRVVVDQAAWERQQQRFEQRLALHSNTAWQNVNDATHVDTAAVAPTRLQNVTDDRTSRPKEIHEGGDADGGAMAPGTKSTAHGGSSVMAHASKTNQDAANGNKDDQDEVEYHDYAAESCEPDEAAVTEVPADDFAKRVQRDMRSLGFGEEVTKELDLMDFMDLGEQRLALRRFIIQHMAPPEFRESLKDIYY